jgi:hypothetical protein
VTGIIALALVGGCTSSADSRHATAASTTTTATTSTTTQPESPTRPWQPADLDAAIDRATTFLTTNLDLADPVTLGTYGYLGRNYAIADLAAATAHARSIGRPNDWHGLLWRLVDPAAGVEPTTDPNAADELLIGRALDCDRTPVPSGYLADLRAFADRDDFGLTHSALALQWLVENRCMVAGRDDLRTEVAARLVSALQRSRSVTDTTACFGARLAYLGIATEVSDEWVGRLLGAQRPDGSWSENPTRTNQSAWHTTLLALWTLLGVRQPADTVPMIETGVLAPPVVLPTR